MKRIELRIFKVLMVIFGINNASKIARKFFDICYWIKYMPRVYITRLDTLYLLFKLKRYIK